MCSSDLEDQIPKAVVQERYERLVELQERVSWEENRKLEGTEVEVLVTVGDGRKDAATGRLSGRARDGRLVHFNVTPSETDPTGNAEGVRPGDVITTKVTYGAPHHLVADSEVLTHRATKAGDAWAAGKATKLPGVSLGMPSIGRKPQAKAETPGCAC